MNSTFDVRWTTAAQRQLAKLSGARAEEVIAYVDGTESTHGGVAMAPRASGESFQAGGRSLWRYRLGQLRIIVSLELEWVVVLAVQGDDVGTSSLP